MNDRRVRFWVQYNDGKPMPSPELTRILHESQWAFDNDDPVGAMEALDEIYPYMEGALELAGPPPTLIDTTPFLTYDNQYLNTLPIGKTCRQSLDGPDLIVLAVPSGPSQRLKTLVKVYDTSTRKSRNILGTSTVYIQR